MTLQEAIELKLDCLDQLGEAKQAGKRDWTEALEKRLASLREVIARKRAEETKGKLATLLTVGR